MNTLILKPRLSEQTYLLAQQRRTYVFEVAKSANKHTVARAVAEQFNVEVQSVNMVNVKGKQKATVSLTGRRRRNAQGVRSDVKKAYVMLVPGASIPVFAAVEEAEKKEEATQKNVEKLAAKQAQKETKQTKAASPKAAGHGLRMFKKQGDK